VKTCEDVAPSFGENRPGCFAMTTPRLTLPSITEQFLAVTPHPPYSPDLAPCDFFLFQNMKLKLKGRRFDTIGEIQAESQSVLESDRK
jgi:hypothetical protein